jgi:hypothetical protein
MALIGLSSSQATLKFEEFRNIPGVRVSRDCAGMSMDVVDVQVNGIPQGKFRILNGVAFVELRNPVTINGKSITSVTLHVNCR